MSANHMRVFLGIASAVAVLVNGFGARQSWSDEVQTIERDDGSVVRITRKTDGTYTWARRPPRPAVTPTEPNPPLPDWTSESVAADGAALRRAIGTYVPALVLDRRLRAWENERAGRARAASGQAALGAVKMGRVGDPELEPFVPDARAEVLSSRGAEDALDDELPGQDTLATLASVVGASAATIAAFEAACPEAGVSDAASPKGVACANFRAALGTITDEGTDVANAITDKAKKLATGARNRARTAAAAEVSGGTAVVAGAQASYEIESCGWNKETELEAGTAGSPSTFKAVSDVADIDGQENPSLYKSPSGTCSGVADDAQPKMCFGRVSCVIKFGSPEVKLALEDITASCMAQAGSACLDAKTCVASAGVVAGARVQGLITGKVKGISGSDKKSFNDLDADTKKAITGQ